MAKEFCLKLEKSAQPLLWTQAAMRDRSARHQARTADACLIVLLTDWTLYVPQRRRCPLAVTAPIACES